MGLLPHVAVGCCGVWQHPPELAVCFSGFPLELLGINAAVSTVHTISLLPMHAP